MQFWRWRGRCTGARFDGKIKSAWLWLGREERGGEGEAKERGEADGGTRKRKGKKKRREGEMMGDLPARHDLGMATI